MTGTQVIGASASQFASGDGAFHIVTPLVLAALTVASWALRSRIAG